MSTTAPASRWLKLNPTITAVGMAGLGVAFFGSYFMQWGHWYPPNGQPWPMADAADASPQVPWNAVSQNPPNSALIYLPLLLIAPGLYVTFGLLGSLARGRGRRVFGTLSLAPAFLAVAQAGFIFVTGGVCDCTWRLSIDAGAWFALAVGALMVIFAILLLSQIGGISPHNPVRS